MKCIECSEEANWVCSSCGLCINCHDSETLENAAAQMLLLHRDTSLEHFIHWLQASAVESADGEVMMRIVITHLAHMCNILVDIALKEQEIGKMSQTEKFNELAAGLSGVSLAPDEQEMNELLSDITNFLDHGGNEGE